jgi:hypothetical protein
VHATKAYWGEEVQLHAFLMTLNGGQQAALHTGLFTVEKESPESTEQEDEWDPASVLMLRRREKYPALPGIEAQFLGHPVSSPVMTLSTGHEH